MNMFLPTPFRALLAVLAVTGGCGRASDPAGPAAVEEGIAVGQRAPEFALKDAAGRTVRLADYRGKVVLFEFSAMW